MAGIIDRVGSTMPDRPPDGPAVRPPRTYNRTLRLRRAEETRARIVAAAAALLARRAFTVRAVATQAEVSERTVYRHFTNEAALRAAASPVATGAAAAADRPRDDLLALVAQTAPHWSESDRIAGAAILDVLWSADAHDRLAAWKLDPERITAVVSWATRLVESAARSGAPPS